MKNTAITLPLCVALSSFATYFAQHPDGLPAWAPIVAAATVVAVASVIHLYQDKPGSNG